MLVPSGEILSDNTADGLTQDFTLLPYAVGTLNAKYHYCFDATSFKANLTLLYKGRLKTKAALNYGRAE